MSLRRVMMGGVGWDEVGWRGWVYGVSMGYVKWSSITSCRRRAVYFTSLLERGLWYLCEIFDKRVRGVCATKLICSIRYSRIA